MKLYLPLQPNVLGFSVNAFLCDYVTDNGGMGQRGHSSCKKDTADGKSDGRTMIKGGEDEGEHYLSSVRTESASYLIMDK